MKRQLTDFEDALLGLAVIVIGFGLFLTLLFTYLSK